MPNIVYQNFGNQLIGKWPGKSIRQKDGRITKTGQIHLGKVISKEKQIFWTRNKGYYHFNVETLGFEAVDPKDIPDNFVENDKSRKPLPVIVDFGDSYFLDHLIKGIKYDKVIDSIEYGNLDSLYAMIFYYVLDTGVAKDMNIWFKQNYVSYLFPKANIASQRISELLAKIGDPAVKRRFLEEHIKYVTKNVGQELSILVDSTGLPNSCSLPITRVSNHGGDVNIEFRLIAVVQKSTGIPIYYEYVHGNVVDVSTLNRILSMLQELGHKVDYCAGDSAYSCPALIERLVLSGIDFMTRLNPAYDMYKQAVNEHYDELMNDSNNLIRYGDRVVKIVKIKSVVAHDKTTKEEVYGYIYLCCDVMARMGKSMRKLNIATKDKTKTGAELLELCDNLGVFAIISTKDLPNEQILPEYYMRASVEQYFDFGKNYAHFLPVAKHNLETVEGHLLLSFIATFFFVLIKNRLGIVDDQYIEIPSVQNNDQNVIDDFEPVEIEIGQGEKKHLAKILEQQRYESIASSSSKTLFKEARGHKADVFPTKLITSVATAQFKNFCESFGIHLPHELLRMDNKLIPYDANNKELSDDVDLRKIFAVKAPLTEAEIIKLRDKKAERNRQKLIKELVAQGYIQDDKVSTDNQKSKEKKTKKSKKSKDLSTPKVPKKRGRPFGSKNKKTLEREERIRKGLEKPEPKKKKGRPLGSKNKKTLERERKIATGEIVIPPKILKKRGRPLGKKDSKPRAPKKLKS